MGELTHKATRAAFGKAIELTLKHVEKDREKGLLQLVDLTEKYMGDNFQKENYSWFPGYKLQGLMLLTACPSIVDLFLCCRLQRLVKFSH